MTTTETEFPALFKMEKAKRIQIAQDLWDSVMDEAERLPTSDELKAELDRRWEEHLKHPDDLVLWGDVKREIRSPHA